MKISKVMNNFSYLFFPKRCACCDEIIYPFETLCKSCKPENCRIPYPKCPKCSQEKDRCDCKDGNFKFDNLLSAFYYKDEISRSVRLFKFNAHTDNGKFLASNMAELLMTDYYYREIDMIASVAMTRRRKNFRGFSQTDYLAKIISKKTGIPFNKNVLIKTRETMPQVGLKAKDRKENLRGAFKTNQKYDLKGKTVLLVDDIKTTGATLNECTKMLKKAGAKKVVCLTAAITKEELKGEA